jgi:hypothetical protein
MRPTPAPAAFLVETGPRGYVVRAAEGPPLLLQLVQGVALAFGAALAAAALMIVAWPLGLGLGLTGFHGGLATLTGAGAALLLWFATRGGTVELEVDLARGELREIVRHRAGPPSVLARHGLDGGAALAVHRGAGEPSLILRFGPDRPGLCIARGPEPALLALRARLESDLLAQGDTIRRPDAAPLPQAA